MKTLTIRKIHPEMEEAIQYVKTLKWTNDLVSRTWGAKTNTKAIEAIIIDWWKNNNPKELKP